MPAAVRLGEPFRDRQAETCAGLVRTSGDAVERLEDPLTLGLGNARPSIGDADSTS